MTLDGDGTYNMIKDGERFTSEIVIIGKAEEGLSRPDIVKIRNGKSTYIGFLKETARQGEKNAIEIMLNGIGKILGVAMADTVGVFSDDGCSDLIAIISISVASNPGEQFICFREMRDQLYFDYKAGVLASDNWLNRWITIRERRRLLPDDMWEVDAVCRQDYIDCIMFAFEISGLYFAKHRIQAAEFESDYVKMMLFDILIGQTDRSPSNYGIVIDQNKKSARLAPLFDNSTLTKPYIQKGIISFNHLLLDRCLMAEIVFEMFEKQATAFRDKLSGCLDGILQTANRSEPYYTKDTSFFLVERIKEGAEIIEAL